MDGTLNLPTFNTGISLRTKTLGLLLGLLAVFIVLLYVCSQEILLSGFEDLERDLAQDDLQRVLNVLDNELANLNTLTVDWAEWDDTYAFMQGQEPGYVASNMVDDTFETLQLNLILLIDEQGELAYGKAYRLNERRSIPLNNILIAQYLSFGPLRHYQSGAAAAGSYDPGVVSTPRGPMLVSVHPILTSEGEGPARGILVMGRYLDEQAITDLATTVAVDLDLQHFDFRALPPDFAQAREAIMESGDTRHIEILDGDTLAGYALVNDITGSPALLLRVLLPRNVTNEAFDSIRFFMIGLLVAGLLLVLGTLVLLEWQVLSRVLRLSNAVHTIGRNGKLNQRVAVAGRDEISRLGSSINGMLEAIQQTQHSLAESQLRTQRIITSISDVLYVVHVDAAGNVLDHQLPSPQLAELTGYPLAEFQHDWHFWQTLIHPDDVEDARKHITNVLAGDGHEIEYRVRCATGGWRWLRDRLHPNPEPDGTLTLYGVLSDITARKRTEAELAQSERTARAFQDRLKSLLEVNADLSKVDTLDALSRRIIELGHTRLGFDRMALFLLEDGGATMAGTYAIDMQGNLSDQRDLRRPVAEDPAIEAVLAKREWTHVWHNGTLGQPGAPAGRDWHAVATLWSGDSAIGWIAVDNLLNHQPLQPSQIELLSLLGTSVSYLITRARAEIALRASEARYRALFEQATDAIFTMRGSVFVDCNSRALEMFGTTREQIIGQPPYRFSPSRQPDGRSSREVAREKIKLAMTSGLQIFEWQHTRADGTPFDAEVALSLVEIGDQVYMQALVRDISERKATERALRESEERYFTLFDRMPIELYRSTPEGKLLDANAAFVRLLGYDDIDDLRRVNARMLYVDPVDRNRWQTALERSDVMREFEVRFRRRDGSMFWAANTARVVRGADGKVQYYEGSLRDITARKKAQDELRQSQERLDLALKAAELGLWDWYLAEGRVIYNSRWAEISGYEPDDLGEHEGVWPTLVHPEDWPAVDAKLQAHLAGTIPVFETEYRLRTKTGEWKWILDRGKVVSRDDDGAPLRMTGTLLDITTRKQAETEREKLLQQMRSRAAELATVAAISQQATQILDMGDLLWKTCELIRDNFDLYHVQVYLFDAAHGRLNWAAGKGAADDVHEVLEQAGHNIPVAHDRSLVARAARERRPVLVNDVAQDATFLPNALLPDTSAEMALPMVVGDTLIGVLDVQDSRLNRFDEQDLHIQTTLAAQIAIAMYNAQLFTDNARRLAIIEHSQDAIALSSLEQPDYFPNYINPAGLRMFGYESLDAVEQKSLNAFYTPASCAELVEEIIPAVKRKGFWRGETEMQVRDGSVVPVEQTVFLIRNEQGAARDAATIITDISARRQAENALRRANRAFRTLSECNQAMVRAVDEAGLLREICEIIVTVGGYRMAWVGLVTDASDRPSLVQPAAHAGHASGYLDEIARIRVEEPGARGPSQRAVTHKEPVIVRNIADESIIEPWRDAALERGYQAMVALPLLHDQLALGTLNVYSATPDIFSADEVTLLSELASDLAYGITTMRTRQERQRVVQQLSENEANLSALIENTTAAIWSLDRELRLVTANSNAQQIFPYLLDSDPEPDTGFLDSLKPELREDWQALLERVLDGERVVIERDFIPEGAYTADTTSYEIWLSPILRPDSADVTGVTVFAADMTRRKLDEARLVQLNAQLAQRNRQLLALYDAGRVLSATLDEYEIYRVLYNHVVQPVFGADSLVVARYDRDADLIHCQFAITDGEEQDASELPPLPMGDGPNSETLRTGKPRIVKLPTAEQESDTPGHYVHYGDRREPQSGIYVPLVFGGEVRSVFTVQHYDADAFSEEDVSLLSAVANQVAVAVQNAQLFTAEHEQRALAEALQATVAAISSTLDPETVMDRILENLKRVVPNDAASIVLIDGDRGRIARHIGFEQRGLGAYVDALEFDVSTLSKFQQMVDTRQPVRILDTLHSPEWIYSNELDWIRSYVGAPILAGDRLLGVLNVDSARPGFFTARHARRLQAFADQAAIAVQNAQLFAAEREQRQFAETLRDIAVTINLSQDPESILNELLRNIKRVVPHDAATLLLVEAGVARVACASGFEAYGLGDWIRKLHLDVESNALVRDLMRSGKPVIIPDTATYPGWQHFPETAWQQACITVPIQREGDVLGFLNLYSTQQNFFTEQHSERLQAFAHQAASAIMNVQLFAAEREQRVLAEALRDTAAAINRTLEFDRVLDFVLASAQRVMPHDAANIMLIEDGVARVVRGRGYDKYGMGTWVKQLRYVVDEIPVWEEMFRTGQPFALPDTHKDPDWLPIPQEAWIRSTVKAPIRVEGRIIGILHLDSETPDSFTQAHAERLQPFADQAATALRNAEFFAAEHAQRTLAEALRATAEAISGTLEFDEVLERILYNVGLVVPYDSASVLLIDEDKVRIAAQSPEPDAPEERAWAETFRFTLSETANLWQMFQTGAPLVLPRVQDYDAWVVVEAMAWIKSHTGAPIRHEGQVIGFVTLDSATADFYTGEHADRLQAFADQAAIAIRNAQLFEAVQRYATELEHRVAERTIELEQQSAQLRAILDSITEGVIYDEKLAVKYTNRAMTELTGYEPNEFTRYIDVLRSNEIDEDGYEALIQEIYDQVEEQGVWQGDLMVRRKEQSEFEARLTVTRVRNSEGAIVGAVSVLRDVSQEKELQRQKDRFIASASHELRTPLTNFKTRLYLLKAQPDKAASHLTILNQVVNNMAELVENMLDMSRFERGVIPLHRRTVVLQDLIREVVTVQRAETETKQIALRVELPERPLYAHIDVQRMRQVITNLIANGINYTSQGGTITVALTAQGDRAQLRVSDTGIGIPPDQITHIFEPFFRANKEAAEGTGLGLTIAREIVRLHDGTITVTSAPGEGSTFIVTLDLAE